MDTHNTAAVTTAGIDTCDLSLDARLRLGALLGTYRSLKTDLDLLDAQLAEECKTIWSVMQEDGVAKTVVDDCRLTVVGGFSSKLDKVKFVQLGGNLQTLAAATVRKPKKPYLKITIGKDEDNADD
jgi:hypothetical protein